MRTNNYLQAILCLGLLITLGSCEKEMVGDPREHEQSALFQATPVAPELSEASGMADSKTHPKHLWVHEDSGNATQLYLLGYDGNINRKVFLKGTTNRDWEAMARLGNDLYVADIGDNNQVHKSYWIYKFAEPTADIDTVSSIQKINFTYADGAHDAEAFLIDAKTQDIFLITKRDSPSRIYKLSLSAANKGLYVATLVGTLTYAGVVGAAQSPDGKDIIIKTYTGLYRYNRTAEESIDEALGKNFEVLPYQLEPQGEAVTFANDNSGFFTLSEKGLASAVSLYFYSRNTVL
ncbi:hypothetical protein [uncultured Pontibacter sp.]|uniref:hypothetical protein n=1 Tax=uncultured Pontibacter sp. TaxID=453356 RepID=UPI00262DB154|nr:hypothetical protein [uncultured Pontibacter sp.]